MIPKIIHYAWIGTPMPNEVKERVNEWKQLLPEWKFMLWNESNYNFNQFSFTQQKIKEKDWGFAADELRYDVVYKYGGFYFDTDMILKKSLDPLLKNKAVFGFMYDNNLLTSFFGAVPGNPLLKKILAEYANKDNWDKLMTMTSNPFVTNVLLQEKRTLVMNGKLQEFNDGTVIFPRDYFCYPSRNKNGNYAEHLFDNSWGNSKDGLEGILKNLIKSIMPITYGKISNKRGIKYSQKFLIR